jgi:hypothetical protein
MMSLCLVMSKNNQKLFAKTLSQLHILSLGSRTYHRNHRKLQLTLILICIMMKCKCKQQKGTAWSVYGITYSSYLSAFWIISSIKALANIW